MDPVTITPTKMYIRNLTKDREATSKIDDLWRLYKCPATGPLKSPVEVLSVGLY